MFIIFQYWMLALLSTPVGQSGLHQELHNQKHCTSRRLVDTSSGYGSQIQYIYVLQLKAIPVRPRLSVAIPRRYEIHFMHSYKDSLLSLG